MDQQKLKKLLEFYEEQLYQNILPFWFKNAIDDQYGGYYTCFNNSGTRMLSTDKYVWSQGRFIWILAKLTELNDQKIDYLQIAKSGFDFLKEKCFLDNGNCVFLLSREGEPKEQVAGQGYDTSIYVDCFVVLGFSKYAMMCKDPEALEIALRLYDLIIKRIARNDFRTDPYPIPKGYRAHGIPMILLNTSQELAAALVKLAHPRAESVQAKCSGFLDEILGSFLIKNGIILEMVNQSLDSDDSIMGRYINPGHSIEDMWFVLQQAVKQQDQESIAKGITVIEKMFEIGWDQEYGGLILYADRDGGQPTGSIRGFEDSPMVMKLKNDWDNKLWWVHSEALYTTLLAYQLTGKESMETLYQQAHDYTFRTFPNPDRTIGEWIQIRDRQGKPIEKTVALPVKDPFHITRNFILIIELLRKMIQ